MKVTGSVPTPIPARTPVSPLAPKKVSGKIFDLVLEGQNTLNAPAKKAPSTNDYGLDMMGTNTGSDFGLGLTQGGNSHLAQFLQNPALAKYYYQALTDFL